MLRILLVACIMTLAGWGAGVSPASAQSLIWSLPAEEASWVRFEGTYKDKQSLPDSSEGDLELEWRRAVTIKSVGKQTVDYQGVATPCRWIEITSVTGKESEQGIQPGPFGTRIYKVLVPENKVIGKVVDGENIPVSFIPIIKGYRKIGDREPTPINQKVLAADPMLAMIAYYPNLKPEGEAEDLQTPEGAVSARKYVGTETLESETARTIQEGTLWVSKDSPFGLAKFQVKVVLQVKDLTAPKEEFKQTAEIVVDMAAVAKGNDARSELPELE